MPSNPGRCIFLPQKRPCVALVHDELHHIVYWPLLNMSMLCLLISNYILSSFKMYQVAFTNASICQSKASSHYNHGTTTVLTLSAVAAVVGGAVTGWAAIYSEGQGVIASVDLWKLC